MRKKQIIFIKGEIYAQSLTDDQIICTETTCSYSTKHWKGTVITDLKYPRGYHSESWTANDTWKTREELQKNRR